MPNQYTPAGVSRRPLTDAQLRLLLKTHPDEWTRVFRGAGRGFLRKERQRGLKKFPPEVVVETAAEPSMP